MPTRSMHRLQWRKVCNRQKNFRNQLPTRCKGRRKGRLNGEGHHAGPGIPPGDVIIVVDEQPHPSFKRVQNDLITRVKIDLVTALAGGAFKHNFLDGRTLVAKILPGEVIKPEDVKRIPGEGMPYHGGSSRGDLFIQFDVVLSVKELGSFCINCCSHFNPSENSSNAN